MPATADRLTVAITGPTGDIGRSLLRALERSPKVGRIVAMARRPFDPTQAGLRKTEYRQGDVLDRDALAALFDGADVVVHLAFIIMGGRKETESINLKGTRNVFEAAVAAGVRRIVYASSVAAYGFHADNPERLTEDLAPRGTDRHYYSSQKAALEAVLPEVTRATRRSSRTCSGRASSPDRTRCCCLRTSPTSRCPTGCRRRFCARSR